jgi:hypothetical protein
MLFVMYPPKVLLEGKIEQLTSRLEIEQVRQPVRALLILLHAVYIIFILFLFLFYVIRVNLLFRRPFFHVSFFLSISSFITTTSNLETTITLTLTITIGKERYVSGKHASRTKTLAEVVQAATG